MTSYKSPIRDIRFVRDDLFEFTSLYASLRGFTDVTPDLVDPIIDEMARFSETVLAPLAKGADSEAYSQFIEGSWTSLQGVVHAEIAYQISLAYCKERDRTADPIIFHPDVRRMLLTQKALAEGGRALIYFASKLNDQARYSESEVDRSHAEKLLAFITPIAKAFVTETGYEAANLGLQCLGGHGYIREWGIEQNVRDARISTIYEGTTGIQALDLLGRKVIATKGELSELFIEECFKFCDENICHSEMSCYIDTLCELLHEWKIITAKIVERSNDNPDEIGSASVDYLMYSGYIASAYLWARAGVVASHKRSGTDDNDFYEAKLITAKFYFEKILPRTDSLAKTIIAGSKPLSMNDDCVFA